MAIGGNVRERSEYSKKVGMMEVKVIAVNPDREELSALLGTEIEKDPEYLGEFQEKDADGNPTGLPATKLNITIWVQDVKTNGKYAVRFSLIDKEMISKKGKPQYINSLGNTTWVDSEENLPDWFKKREYRKAKVGEEQLFSFMRNWLGKLDYKDAETTLELDWKKLMNGNTKEIKQQVEGVYADTVAVMATVRSVDKDGENKEYQEIYNRDFLPGYTIKFFRNTKFTEEKLDILKAKDKVARETKKNYLKPFEQFALKVADNEHGVKDAYFLGEAKDYNPEEHLQGSDKVIDDSDATY